MMQVYFLGIVYLLLGAGMLLVDYYGGRLLLLIRLRSTFRSSRVCRLLIVVGGFLLVILTLLFPVPPGPRILGDLIPAMNIFALWIWFVSQAIAISRKRKDDSSAEGEEHPARNREDDMLHYTSSLIETNKRNFGLVTLVVACLHFLVPMFVLL
ncbi:MAG: hypothetical protein SPD11_00100 [Sphaerochaetaceae bacterium]|nr:hypothetical protein [Sphaerochaetaceae bacterium]